MCKTLSKKMKLSIEIEEIREKLNIEFKNRKTLSHPEVVSLSQFLDVKINEYQRLNIEK